MEILKDFGVQPILLLAQIINFTILLLILRMLVYKPVVKLLEERKKKIAETYENAKKIEDQLTTTEEERSKLLEKAKEESKKIISEARSVAETIKSEADQEAVKRLEAALKKADEAAAQRFKDMESKLKSEVVDLVVETLKLTTGKVLTKEDQEKIVKTDIKQLSKEN